MTDTVIGFELAKLAKEKGFPQLLCYTENRYYYSTWKYAIDDHEVETTDDWTLYRKDFQWSRWDVEEESRFDYYFEAPTQSLLQKWLREKHNIYIIPKYNGGTSDEAYFSFKYSHLTMMEQDMIDTETCLPYEEGLEFALLNALNLI